ncbi:hypothetical protein V5N11_031607 [Cardamine amara subsp. amara]|uniref:Uncharacterized protein n=1 Tax=Cardamine amara subsp. amara TaxID=228776 RepID=A0ABD0YYZ5_CARAN
MKAKKKGKVHPSPLPPSINGDDSLSVLKLLPTVILVLVSALSAEDREVLSYLITRSLNTTAIATTESSKKNKKKISHKWDCDCFDCYTSYWFRWDSSPNRELIHQIIDAFEDHLTTGENSARKSNSRAGNKKEIKSEEVMEPTVTSDEVPPKTSDETEISMKIENGHKGLARKVLLDVLSLFNSRFWSFWNPNA